MKLQVVGCSHHNAPIAVRERLAFSAEQTAAALDQLRRAVSRGGGRAAVDLQSRGALRGHRGGVGAHRDADVAEFLARFHGLDPEEIAGHLYQHDGRGGHSAPVHRGRRASTAWWSASRRSSPR